MEIGGYLEFETFYGPEFHLGAIRLNSGRNCLAYLIETRRIQNIALPFLICSSVINICNKYGVEIDFYHISEDFKPILDNNHANGVFLYIVNYYGQLTNEYIQQLAEEYRNIIIDNAQAFFQTPVLGVDTIYTCRKFFGVPDGAYLYTDALLGHDLKQDVSHNKMAHLLGRFEEDAASHYEEFKQNENALEQVPVMGMSKLTTNILRAINYSRVKGIRETNFNYLYHVLEEQNELKLHIPVGPFAFPYYANDGKKLRMELQDNSIYIPTLWPNVLDECMKGSLEYQYAINILPIPCDQRYDTVQMRFLLSNIL